MIEEDNRQMDVWNFVVIAVCLAIILGGLAILYLGGVN